jgi:hypothetical protein
MSTATSGTQTLKERAAEAHDKIKREQDARHNEEYREQCDMLANLAAKTLGVEREEIEFERRSEYGAALGKIEGLSFGVYAADYGWTLQLLSPCEQCGQERSATVVSLERLGELIAGPQFFYHYCPPKRDESDTPEARLITAIQDMIGNSISER